MSPNNETPDDQPGGLDKSPENEPGEAKPPLPKSAEERFLEQVEGLRNSVDPSYVNDTWEHCGEDAASSSSAPVRTVPPACRPASSTQK
jgi:hypothetical protein